MYLRTDEETEAVGALCMASRLAYGLDRDLHLWRWVIIALHIAAQGFMVLSLRHGNGLASLKKSCATAWLKAYENSLPYPEERLDSFIGLYNKIKSKKYGELSGNKRFVPEGTHDDSFRRLNNFRNEFIHFTPKGWSLDINGLPKNCIDAVDVIEFLGWKTENILWHDSSLLKQSKHCAFKFKEQMNALHNLYRQIESEGEGD